MKYMMKQEEILLCIVMYLEIEISQFLIKISNDYLNFILIKILISLNIDIFLIIILIIKLKICYKLYKKILFVYFYILVYLKYVINLYCSVK